jgi:hypothetical protein
MDFRVAPQAESDLDETWYFLATQSSNIDVADRVIDSITARFALLARQGSRTIGNSRCGSSQTRAATSPSSPLSALPVMTSLPSSNSIAEPEMRSSSRLPLPNRAFF